MMGPELIALDEPYEGWPMMLKIGSQGVFLNSPQDALVFLAQEYALNFVLPYWEAEEEDEDESDDPISRVFVGTNIPFERLHFPAEFSPDPRATPYFRRYGANRLMGDIRQWASHFWPAEKDVDREVTAVADEIRHRMIENGGWDESLSLVETK